MSLAENDYSNIPSAPNDFIFIPRAADKINLFFQSVGEELQVIPRKVYIRNKYHPPKPRKDVASEIINMYIKMQESIDKILAYPLAQHFIDISPKLPSLTAIKEKIEEYDGGYSVYKFGNDLRNLCDFYFRYYSNSPDEYQRTFYMSEFCESVIHDLELNKQILYRPKREVTIQEKEELSQNITNLNYKSLKRVLKFLSGFVNQNEEEEELKTYEFDIENLSARKVKKLKKLVDKLIRRQEKEKQLERERKGRKGRRRIQDRFFDRIMQLKVFIFYLIVIERFGVCLAKTMKISFPRSFYKYNCTI